MSKPVIIVISCLLPVILLLANLKESKVMAIPEKQSCTKIPVVPVDELPVGYSNIYLYKIDI